MYPDKTLQNLSNSFRGQAPINSRLIRNVELGLYPITSKKVAESK